jgi:ribosome-associated protein
MAAKKKTAKKPSSKPKAVKAPAKRKASPAKKAAPKTVKAKTKTVKAKASSAPKKAKRAPPRKAKRPALKPKRTATKRAAAKPAARSAISNPEAHALAQRIAKVALEKKAMNVIIIDTFERSSAVGYDYVVLASGDGDRQLAAIADGVDDVLRPDGQRPQGVQQSVDWVSMDYGSVIAHVFTPERRGMVDIEGLWSGASQVPLEA